MTKMKNEKEKDNKKLEELQRKLKHAREEMMEQKEKAEKKGGTMGKGLEKENVELRVRIERLKNDLDKAKEAQALSGQTRKIQETRQKKGGIEKVDKSMVMRTTLRPNIEWSENSEGGREVKYATEGMEGHEATSGQKYTKWITDKAIYEHARIKPTPEGEQEVVIETTGGKGYMLTMGNIFKEGQLYGRLKYGQVHEICQRVEHFQIQIEKEIDALRAAEETYETNKTEEGEIQILTHKEKADRLLLKLHQYNIVKEENIAREINGKIVEQLMEKLNEDDKLEKEDKGPKPTEEENRGPKPGDKRNKEGKPTPGARDQRRMREGINK